MKFVGKANWFIPKSWNPSEQMLEIEVGPYLDRSRTEIINKLVNQYNLVGIYL